MFRIYFTIFTKKPRPFKLLRIKKQTQRLVRRGRWQIRETKICIWSLTLDSLARDLVFYSVLNIDRFMLDVTLTISSWFTTSGIRWTCPVHVLMKVLNDAKSWKKPLKIHITKGHIKISHSCELPSTDSIQYWWRCSYKLLLWRENRLLWYSLVFLNVDQ